MEEGLDDSAVLGSDDAASEGEDPTQVLKFENVHCDYLQRDDLIIPKSRTWEEVPWIGIRAFLTNRKRLDSN